MLGSKGLLAVAAGLALGGCVAAPVQSGFTVLPGEGKTEADLRADDARCRLPTPAVAATATTPGTQAAPVTADRYYACMASRGQAVIQQQVQTYPAYAGYPYPVYPAYAYPYYGYGYGYPYGGSYFGPYVGFGVGFGYGGFYGGRGFGRGGWGGGYGGYHGFGGPRGGFHR